MKIKNIISVGGGCDSMYLSSLLGIRIKGPIDNAGSLKGFVGVEELINDTLYNSFINKNYELFDSNPFNDNPFRCIIGYWDFVHNDVSTEKTQNELTKRFDLFHKFLKESETNNELFFMYSLIWHDIKITETDIENTFNKLPDYVKNKLIIVHPWMDEEHQYLHSWKFLNYPIFRISHYKMQPLFNQLPNEEIINDFNKWWNSNKNFYEKLNNCTYDLIKI